MGPPIGVLQGSPGHVNGSSEVYNHDSTPLPQRHAFSSSLGKDPLVAYGNQQRAAFIGPNGQLLDNRMTSLTIEDSNLYGLEKEQVTLLAEVDDDPQLVGYCFLVLIRVCLTVNVQAMTVTFFYACVRKMLIAGTIITRYTNPILIITILLV